MAAALLQHALAAQPEPLRSVKVMSAGVAARPGEPVSENSVLALKKVGIDISEHRSQSLTQRMLDEALAVICMTESHRAMIQVQAEPVPRNLFLFPSFILLAIFLGGPMQSGIIMLINLIKTGSLI